MRVALFRVLAVFLVILSSYNVSAGESGVRLGYIGNMYIGDNQLTTGYYGAIGDTPLIFNADNRMIYTFKNKFGNNVSFSIFHQFSNVVEIDVGFIFGKSTVEVKQIAEYSYFGDMNIYYSGSYNHPEEDDASMQVGIINPKLLFHIPNTSKNIDPYLGVGINIIRATAKGELTFAMPYVWDDGSYYYIEIGSYAHTEPVAYDGTETIVALNILAGLDITMSETSALYIDLSYMVQFQKSFEEFDEIITRTDASEVFNLIGYDNDGWDLNNLSMMIGFKFFFSR